MERRDIRRIGQAPPAPEPDELLLAYSWFAADRRGQMILDDLTRKAQSPALDTSHPDPNLAVGILFQMSLVRYVLGKIDHATQANQR